MRSSASSTKSDPFEKYNAERDPKNKARYLPPSKLKKAPSNYQGRRTVKFKQENEYSEEHFGNLKKEKRPAPRKIQCVTEIMVDISDSDSCDLEDTASQDRPLSSCLVSNPLMRSASQNSAMFSTPAPVDIVKQQKMDFMDYMRKRAQKGREKETDTKEEKKISEALIDKLYHKDGFKIPYIQTTKQKKTNKTLEDIIYRKFNNKGSVNKILQKTAKLQKSLDEKLTTKLPEDDATGQAMRYYLESRFLSIQRSVAANYQGRDRKRGKVDKRFIKLQSQSRQDVKRKTQNFPMYDMKQLDFIDANKLLSKRLNEYEFDNDIDSDEDEIAKSAYIRLKDLTVTLKEHTNKGVMMENDPDDLAIKRHVGLPDDHKA